MLHSLYRMFTICSDVKNGVINVGNIYTLLTKETLMTNKVSNDKNKMKGCYHLSCVHRLSITLFYNHSGLKSLEKTFNPN